MPAQILLLPHAPHSGCPPGGTLCPATDLPPLPGDLVQVIQVTTICGVALVLLALVLALVNARRGWRWPRFTLSALALLGAGVLLLVANRAQEAWEPFAALHMPQGASYNDWVVRITSATLYSFAPTVVRFRGLMVLGCLLLLALVIATVAQGVKLAGQRNDT